MARTPMFDPKSTEARSPWLAGLTEACNKLSGVLQLKTATFTDFQLSPVDDKRRIWQTPLGNKLWMESPTPVVRINGVVESESSGNFTINYLGGSIEFDRLSIPAEGTIISVDATYIVGESSVIENLITELEKVGEKAEQSKGYFPTLTELEGTYPAGENGDYAIIGEDKMQLYLWNPNTEQWEPSSADTSNFYDKEEIDEFLEGKEDLIIPHSGETEEANDFYFSGKKEWVNLYDKVKETPLTDLDTTLEGPVENTDTVGEAIGKLQSQISAYVHDLFGTSAPTTETVGNIGQDYTNTANGDKYHLVSIDGDSYIWEKYADQESLEEKVDKVIPSSSGNIAILDEDGNLVDSGKGINDVGKLSKQDTVTLNVSGWVENDSTYTQTVTVESVLEDATKQNIMVSPYPDATNIDTISKFRMFCSLQGSNTLTFTALSGPPTSNAVFNISIQAI